VQGEEPELEVLHVAEAVPGSDRLPRRIEAHVKICTLALLLERAAELAAGQPWARIRAALDHLQATEYQTESHRFFRRNEVHPEVRQVLKKLAIPEPCDVLGVV